MNAERTIPYFKEYVIGDLKNGKNVLVSAHGNSLRSIVMYIENISKEDVVKLEIQTAVPRTYVFENDDFTRINN
jgi:2,3-bisphosphoglycerate-dependent phosphoglycerate mutase